jgi:non-ribosomal peptide synthetase component F
VVASILGVLKAGKFYVPLDPSYPQARTTYMLEDSDAHLIVTNTQNLSLAKELAQNGGQVMNFDELDLSLSTENLDYHTGDLGLMLADGCLLHMGKKFSR